MDRKSLHRRTWNRTRRIVVLSTVTALILAPLIVVLTHGPAAHAAAASWTAEHAAHGHDLDHGHTHDEAEHPHQGGLVGGHNPADHDHQFHALICQPTNTLKPRPDKVQCALRDACRNMTLEGPMRPPRSV